MTQHLDYQVILLTGQSDPWRCALSPVQQAFLDQSVPRQAQLPTNFPYVAGSAPYRATPLLAASIRNAWQYFGSRSQGFGNRHAATISRLIAQREQTVFLAGSCGLELFNNFRLPSSLISKVRLFAYGPVARRRPECPHVLVGSRRDWLSRCFFPQPDDWVDCTHVDYLRAPAVRSLWAEFIRETTLSRRACA